MENKIHALSEEGNLRVLPENKSEYKREFLAGTTSFLAMAYIIAVNPSILSAAGMPAGDKVTATCISAVIGCLIMGFYAKLPFGLAPGMGLNAFFFSSYRNGNFLGSSSYSCFCRRNNIYTFIII